MLCAVCRFLFIIFFHVFFFSYIFENVMIPKCHRNNIEFIFLHLCTMHPYIYIYSQGCCKQEIEGEEKKKMFSTCIHNSNIINNKSKRHNQQTCSQPTFLPTLAYICSQNVVYNLSTGNQYVHESHQLYLMKN